MQRETRYNLIFLAVLLAVLLPGAVILFRKKMEPTVRPMYLPDPVPTAVAYLSPEPTPPGKTRVEPARTAEWVKGLARDRGVMEVLRGSDGLPLTSDSKTFQIVSARPAGQAIHVTLIEWRDPSANWTLNGRPPAKSHQTQLGIPQIIREELGEYGVVVPPKEIVWRELEFAADRQGPSSRIVRTGAGSANQDTLDFVLPFTSPTTATN